MDPTIRLIPSHLLHQRHNMRKHVDASALYDLKEDVRRHNAEGAGQFGSGIHTPLEIYQDPSDGVLVILEGNRRHTVVQMLEVERTGYNAVGLPCITVAAPRSLWEQTEATMSRHNRDEISILDLVARAVELHNLPTASGKSATWDDVVQVMGSKNWPDLQHLLQLIPEIQAAVLLPKEHPGSVRAELGAMIGRRLSPELQRRHIKDLTDPKCKNRRVLENLIKSILAGNAMREAVNGREPVIAFSSFIVDTESHPNGTNGTDPGLEIYQPPVSDRPTPADVAVVQYYLQQFVKPLTLIETAAGECQGVLADPEVLSELTQLTERFVYLQSLGEQLQRQKEAVYA